MEKRMSKLLLLNNILHNFFKEDNLNCLQEIKENMKVEFDNDKY